jgi:hypothetical protein
LSSYGPDDGIPELRSALMNKVYIMAPCTHSPGVHIHNGPTDGLDIPHRSMGLKCLYSGKSILIIIVIFNLTVCFLPS